MDKEVIIFAFIPFHLVAVLDNFTPWCLAANL
jgi:hypothetical protein